MNFFKQYLRRASIIAFLGALPVLYSNAQTTSGAVTGTILDSSGASIANATVVAKNEGTNVESRTTTNGSGQYRIENLLVGTYTLITSAQGFAPKAVQNLAIDVNKVATQNITLTVGQASTSVNVIESTATIDTTNAQIQTTFTPRELADLPITSSGAGVLNLSLLASGVSSSGAVGAGTGPSVGGQRPRNNNFTIEGIDDNNKSVTGPLVTPPNDDVAEFSLLQNQFSPEYGHSNGGQFNFIIKSGANNYHGMLYEYFINRNLTAIDQSFARSNILTNPRYDNNRLGANFGGPILKNKLFFFAGFEYNPIGQSTSGGQAYAPTAAGYATLAGLSGLSANNIAVLRQYVPPAPTAAAPDTLPSGAYPTVNGQPIQSGIFPIAGPNYQNNYAGVLSLDYNISDKDQLRGRYIYSRQDAVDNAANLPAFYTQTPTRNYLVNISEFHTFAPTVTNELRLGYTRYYNDTPAGDFRFPGLNTFPNLTLDEYNLTLGPDGNAPQFTVINNYQLVDNFAWVNGKHTFKFGFNGFRYISPQSFTQRVRGDYYWLNLDGYLHDLSPDDFGERSAGNVTYYGDQYELGFYGNDDWKLSQNLTINIGLRYQYVTVPFGERSQTLNAVSNVPGLISFGEPQPQKTNFMPRVGFAYSPGTTGNTVFRGGFGIGYDVLFDNLGILSLPPQLQQTNDSDPGVNTPNFLASGGLPATPVTITPTTARANTSGYIPNQQLPKVLNWSFGFQHVFARDYTFEARYLGTHGTNLPVQERINVQAPVTASNTLPTYINTPTQAQLDSLPLTLGALRSASHFIPGYLNAGFMTNITSYKPIGSSIYHGLAVNLNRRFTSGLQGIASYTWSHNIDNSTAEVFSTVTTPRRPQEFQNLQAERSSSALDHRQRASLAIVYDFQVFRNRNWFMKNLVANWEFAPIYTFQTGTLATVQSQQDSNLNQDSFTDRAVLNPSGIEGVGTGVTALKNSAGQTVAYQAINPNAQYIQAGIGVYPNAGRNTLQLRPIDNLDFTVVKRFSFSDRYKLEFQGQFSNTLNHPQYTGGYINDVRPLGFTGNTVRSFLNPANSTFNQPDQAFSSNPRVITVVAKFTF